MENISNKEKMDITKEVHFVLQIANKLRGAYKADKYKDVLIPMLILRRFECALEDTKDKVLKAYAEGEKNPAKRLPKYLTKVSGHLFYNTSKHNLKNLLDDSDNIKENLENYIDGFSPNVKEIFYGKKEDKLNKINGHKGLEFKDEIDKLSRSNRLYTIIKAFSELDLNPKTISNIKMGYIFEDVIRRYSQNVTAGDHYTPREVIQLMVKLVLAENSDDLKKQGKITTVLDMACGTGGMLSIGYEELKKINSSMDIKLFGQEIEGESYSICLADMLIKGQDASNIQFVDTLKKDAFPNQEMRIVIANPPFGRSWGGQEADDGVEEAVREQAKNGIRFIKELPGTGDMQLLFIQHAVYKLSEEGKAVILENSSPLFSGGTTSGESQIRRWLIENDYIEAIIALPDQLFYNTSIAIYAFVLSKNKCKKRINKIQFINAVNFFTELRTSLGNKRKEISKEYIEKIVKLYKDFEENEYSKIFQKEEFLYKEISVYQPLQRNFAINEERIEQFKQSDFASRLYNEDDYNELLETTPRTPKQNKKLKTYEEGKKIKELIIKILEKNIDNKIYKNISSFEKVIDNIFEKEFLNIINYKKKTLLENIVMTLSKMDKTAEIIKNSKGNVELDKETKDSEIIKFSDDIEQYMKKEVYPNVPDAMWFDENKIGAEFPFTRYFYKYKEPKKSKDILKEIIDIEKSLKNPLEDIFND